MFQLACTTPHGNGTVYNSVFRVGPGRKPAKISGYMGSADTFDKAIADFSVAYADQGERDHEVLKKAVRAGKLEVAT